MTTHNHTTNTSILERKLDGIQRKLAALDTSVATVLDKIVNLSDVTDTIYDAISFHREGSYRRDEFPDTYD